MTEKILPLLKVYPSDLAPKALVVGDPARAEQAAGFLQGARRVGSNREYVTFVGLLENQPVTICSHGVGAAGASICFTELMQGGVEIIIRAGTCGALAEPIDDGSLIIATGAVREDGTSDKLVPLAYPAFCQAEVILGLERTAQELKADFYRGIVVSQAHLYPGLLPGTLDLWRRAGALAVEMELAALLVIASLNDRRAGGIFTSDGNLARAQNALTPDSYDPHRSVVKTGVGRMLQVGLGTLVRL
jgi:uridine phosphorylase